MNATRPTVLVTCDFDISLIRAAADEFEFIVIESRGNGQSLAERGIDSALATAHVIITELDTVDDATLNKSPHLGLVISCRGNPVNVDVAACSRRGVPVAYTPGRNAGVTADLAFALVLATVRHTSAAERWLREGNWSPDKTFEPYERFRGIGLADRTMGIVGGGAVGSRMVRRARGFEMDVLVHDPFLAEDHFGAEARVVSIEEVFSSADIVSIHVPLSAATTGMIGARELGMMRSDAYLINAGRAHVVDEPALLSVLRSGAIAGAGFDVFYEEPLADDSEWMTFDNVVLTPHIGGASNDVIREHSRIAMRSLRSWVAGEPITSITRPAEHASESVTS